MLKWANEMAHKGGRASSIRSFKDRSLGTGVFLLDVLNGMKTGYVDYALVSEGSTDEDAYLNAKLSISIARKMGATIWYVASFLDGGRANARQAGARGHCGGTQQTDRHLPGKLDGHERAHVGRRRRRQAPAVAKCRERRGDVMYVDAQCSCDAPGVCAGRRRAPDENQSADACCETSVPNQRREWMQL